ncbi:serine hydrolase domain-containing protein [Fundidesulfovibrio butyratiphilus]
MTNPESSAAGRSDDVGFSNRAVNKANTAGFLRKLPLILALWLLTTCLACAGSHDELASRLDALLAQETEAGRVVGVVVLVSRNGRLIYHRAAGYADRESKTPMREDTVVRLASMSKPFVSAAALSLIAQGKLGLDDMVSEWLPGFTPTLVDGTPAEIRVRHLLTHTSGLGYGFAQDAKGPYRLAKVSDGLDCPDFDEAENLRRLGGVPLFFAPGSRWGYSLATDVLGAVLARAGGAPLPEVVRRTVTQPLGLRHTGFLVTDTSDLSTSYARTTETVDRMGETYVSVSPGGREMTFCPGRVLNPKSPASGGAGMVGTAGDYLTFVEALRTGGGPILSPALSKAMTTNRIGRMQALAPGWGFGYGVGVLVDPEKTHSLYPRGCWFWGGVYGSSFWVDPSNGLSVVVTTNTAPCGAGSDFHETVRTTVYKALGLFPR